MGPVRHTNPIRPRLERHEVESAEADSDHQARGRGADGRDGLAQKSRPVLEAAPVGSGPVQRAQELMPKVAVTVLDIHEREARALSQRRGRCKVIDEPGDLLVAQQRIVPWNAELAIEPGVTIEDHRLQF